MIHLYPRSQYSISHEKLSDTIFLYDHLGGFDQNFCNEILRKIDDQSKLDDRHRIIYYHQYLDDNVKNLYENLKINFDLETQVNYNFKKLISYNTHPELTFQNFLCSFNGSDHVGRKMLVSVLQRLGWFNPKTCSKNFQFMTDNIDGHLADYLEPDRHRFYRSFFIGHNSQEFFDTMYSFGHVRYDHASNVYNLERQLTGSFLHIVSETLATSYYPFVTEKFLYSVVTRGLFLAYAQPGWHDHLERYYGFRRYNKIFDYRFDEIPNPVERLIELMSMIAKFSVLDTDNWRDLYDIEKDTIEYNYDHYFSRNYIKQLEKFY